MAGRTRTRRTLAWERAAIRRGGSGAGRADPGAIFGVLLLKEYLFAGSDDPLGTFGGGDHELAPSVLTHG